MTKSHNIFSEDWKACLHAHYIHVIRTNDTITEPTLRHVLLQTGLSDEELLALQQEALARGPLEPYAAQAPVDDQAAPLEPPLDEEDGEDDLYDDQPDKPEPDAHDNSGGQLSLF